MNLIENVKVSFLSGTPVNKIEFGEILKNLTWEDQGILLKSTVLNEKNIRYPLKKEYQIAFIKHLLKELEDKNEEEIHDQFYECLSMLINSVDKSDFSYKHYKIDNLQYISIKEANSFIRDGTTGLKVWEASIILSNFIIHNVSYFKRKSVIELGSGCSGLVGLILSKLCDCKEIFLSDCHEAVLKTLQENIKLNLKCGENNMENLKTSVLVRERFRINNRTEFGILNIPWENINEIQDELSQLCQPDIILGADIIYDLSIFDALLNCLKALFKICKNSQIEFLLSQTIRNKDTFETFQTLLKNSNFSIQEICLDEIIKTIPLSCDPSSIKMFRIAAM